MVTSARLAIASAAASGEQLRFFDPQRGAYFLTPQEIRESREREAAARAAAEDQARRETAARAAAEAEVERLRRELDALRGGTASSS
jgi:hypothetical protein